MGGCLLLHTDVLLQQICDNTMVIESEAVCNAVCQDVKAQQEQPWTVLYV